MASLSPPSGSREDRERATPLTRRHLLTSHGSHAPPRVVLHLPDLEALSAVALGPPQPTARRRIDQAHTVQSIDTERQSTTDRDKPARPFVHLLRGPLTKLMPQIVGGGGVVGKTLVLLQQPKLLLATIIALGLQLAAALALFTGDGKNDSFDPTPGNTTSVAATETLPKVGPNDPIQTPLSVFGGPPPAPPHTLPGLDPRDLPPWPNEGSVGSLAGPQANQPARLSPAVERTPTLAPSPAVPSTGVLPTLPQLTSPATPSNAKPDEIVQGKPKARLQGTIKKISSGGTTP